MALTSAQLVANISILGASEAKSALQSVGESANSTSNIFKSALGAGVSLATGVAGQAIGFLKDQMQDSIKIAMQHQQVMAQTTEVVKTTGGAAGMTAKSVDDLADSLSKTTKFTHDTIQGGENLLLTFTGIGKNVFPETTRAMLDLSQATGQSLKSSAIQLGKALNDPLTGLTALSRVGVSFSDQEKQMIKTAMAHHDVMAAQKVMLKELETEFGGSAAAAGKTFEGQMQILKNTLEDTKEKIGAALLPILNQLMSFIASVGMPILQKLSDWFTNTAVTAIQSFMDKLKGLGPLFSYVGDMGKMLFSNLGGVFSEAIYIVKRATDGMHLFGSSIPNISNMIKSAGPGLTQPFLAVNNALLGIQDALKKVDLKPLVEGFNRAFSSFSFKGIGGQAGGLFDGILKQLSTAFSPANLQGAISGFNWLVRTIGELLSHVDFSKISGDIQTVGHIMLNLSPAVEIFQALSSHAQELGKWFATSIVPAVQKAAPGFENLFGAIQGLLPVMSQISDVVHNLFQRAFDALLPVFEKAVPIIIQLAGIIADGLGAAIKFLSPYIVEATKAIGDFAGDILERVAPILSQFFDGLKQDLDWIQRYWPAIWGAIGPILKGVWDELVGIVQIAWAILSGVIKIGLDLLSGNWSRAWADMKNMLSGIWGGIQTVIRGGINSMIGVLNLGVDALNGFIDAVERALDSAASAIGLGNPIPITTIPHIPSYAKGTSAHPGGPALVGEEGPEIVILPSGTSVMPAKDTRSILSNIPGYAGGTGDALTDLLNWAAGGAKSVLDNIMKGIQVPTVLGSTLNFAVGVEKTLEKWIMEWINKTLMPKAQAQSAIAGPGMPVNVPGNLLDWIISAIKLTGAPANWANSLAVIAMHESGGNPNAVNNWDINAQQGHPSQGVMQTIPSTFASYMVAGHGNILNPIDNIAAAIGYIKARYGTVFNVPGIASMANGGAYVGYANGTDFAPGGWAWVGERGPEMMYVPKGAQITPHDKIGQGSQPNITVQPASIYLDGRIMATALAPYTVDAIRYNTGSHGR